MMNGNIALDTSVVIRYLNGNQEIVNNVVQFSTIILPVNVVGELIFGAENSGKKLKNFISNSGTIEPYFLRLCHENYLINYQSNSSKVTPFSINSFLASLILSTIPQLILNSHHH